MLYLELDLKLHSSSSVTFKSVEVVVVVAVVDVVAVVAGLKKLVSH